MGEHKMHQLAFQAFLPLSRAAPTSLRNLLLQCHPNPERCCEILPARKSSPMTLWMHQSQTKPAGISERSLELFREQVKYPLFDVVSVPGPIGDELRCAQPEKPPYRFLERAEDSQNDVNIIASCGIITAHVEECVLEARHAVLRSYPGIAEPGGKLYPKERSDACWRDLMAFARVAGYICAVGGTDEFLSTKGFDVLKEVYNDLDVPIEAVITGVRAMWGFMICKAVDIAAERKSVQQKDLCDCIDLAFYALVTRLQKLDVEESV